MARNELEAAADALGLAAQATIDGETSDRLREQSAQFESLANADRGPDHGRIARHEHILTEIAEREGSGETTDHIETALESIRAYRETVEGV